MPSRKILSLACALACVLCLAAGYAQAGQWLALLGVLPALLAWLAGFKWPQRWLPLAGLLLSICLAAAGLFTGAASVLMILSAAFALAAWDMILWNLSLDASALTDTPALLARSHYISLALAIGAGLLAALGGRLLRLQLPFGVLIFLVLLALLSLERLWHTLGD